MDIRQSYYSALYLQQSNSQVRNLTLFWGHSSFNMGSNFYFCCLLHLSTCSPVNCVKSSSLNWTLADSDSSCVTLTTLPQRVLWLQAATFHHTEWQNITKMYADCGVRTAVTTPPTPPILVEKGDTTTSGCSTTEGKSRRPTKFKLGGGEGN
jgi:hypothetical protein